MELSKVSPSTPPPSDSAFLFEDGRRKRRGWDWGLMDYLLLSCFVATFVTRDLLSITAACCAVLWLGLT